jgi:hypothetical protein
MAIVNEWQQVKSFPTPIPSDLLFYEIKDSNIPRNENWNYGDPHPNKTRYPHHELIFVTPVVKGNNPSAEQQWWYAAKRENQDDYNFELSGGEQLIRTYVIKRELFFARPVGHEDAIANEFLYPPAGIASPDIRFPDYCFADDTQKRTEQEFDSIYTVIQRRFIRPVIVSYAFDEQFKQYLKTTTELIPNTTVIPEEQAIGTTVEIQDGNQYHSIRITKEIMLPTNVTYPYEVSSLPATQNFSFPPKLESVNIKYAWAAAYASGHMPAYAEDYFFKVKITEPRPGPYSATVFRFITDNPEAVKALYPITRIPQPVKESISIINWSWFASEELGNKASAAAKEWNLPPTIHNQITVTVDSPDEVEPADYPNYALRNYDNPIAATPGVATFLALTKAIIDYKVREMPLGLYEVSVIEIDCSNLYT